MAKVAAASEVGDGRIKSERRKGDRDVKGRAGGGGRDPRKSPSASSFKSPDVKPKRERKASWPSDESKEPSTRREKSSNRVGDAATPNKPKERRVSNTNSQGQLGAAKSAAAQAAVLREGAEASGSKGLKGGKYAVAPGRSKKAKRPKATPLGQFLQSLSAVLGVSAGVVITRPDAVDAVKALSLSQRQLQRLKRKFTEVDVDQSGTMDSAEFFAMLGEERTPLTDQLFGLMDLDGSGSIEFDEYVAVLLTYCMYSKDDILRFCFDTFDRDHSNSIDEREFTALLSAVNNGQPMFPGNFSTALQNFDTNSDGLIDFQEFKQIDKRYPLIFFPAFRLQDMMMKRTLGERAWARIHARVEKQRHLNEYRRAHGKDPKVTAGDAAWRAITCGLYEEPEVDVDLIESKKPSITSAISAAKNKTQALQANRRKSV